MKIFKNKKRLKIFLAIVVPVLIIALACGIYLGTYYHADVDAITAFSVSQPVIAEKIEGDNLIYKTEDAKTGLIFYPGGKVEYTAYEPLMKACAEKGILCVLVKMPFNLAVFDINAADGIREKYPQIENWYIGGHSLGGSMAASYLAENKDSFKGLILLGSYSTEDFSDGEIDILSIYGSEDRVLNKEKYNENKKNLPKDFTEFVIDGGCHAYFGMYGEQSGDGKPSVTNIQQIRITADVISDFVNAEN